MTVTIKESTDMDKLLRQLPIELRHNAVPRALRANLRPAADRAKQLAPRGKLNHNPSDPPLYTTIRVAIRRYGDVVFGIMGAKYPEGAHQHLVEFGHQKYLWGKETTATVPGKEFLAPAVDQTEAVGRRNMVAKLKEIIVKAGG